MLAEAIRYEAREARRSSQANQIMQGTEMPEAIDGLIEGIESEVNGISE
jgi:hypothetical protein